MKVILILQERPTGATQESQDSSIEQSMICLAPRATRILIILGALLNVISILFPWAPNGRYLPWSIMVGAGTYLPTAHFMIMAVLIRLAAIVGWAGVVLYEYIEGRLVPYVAIMASGSISFTTVILFATRGVSLSWGAYLALVGGVLMVLGVVMEKLEVEIVVEHDRNQEGRKPE